jgi:hypothetical protein
VANTDIAGKPYHVTMTKHIAHESVATPLVKTVVVPGNNSGCVLAAMLHYGQRVIERLVDRTFTDNSNDAAHVYSTTLITV